MTQRLLAPALVAVLGFCSPAAAQQPAAAPPQAPAQLAAPAQPDAEFVREQLHDILRGYPRSVGEILRRDPILMGRADYMASYPQLQAFIAQHPEVQRNVEFYFEGYGSWGREPLDPEYEALGVLLGGMAGLAAFAAFLGVFAWLIRAIIQHRRWLKASQVQADIHTRLMERMTTNDELLAYVQSPAGRRFLEAAPIRPDTESVTSAPVTSIVWSMMAGIVLATLGTGFRLAGTYIGDEDQKAFVVVGLIILALGVGFILASVMAYVLSSRLGLFPPKRVTESTNA
jgi:heme/copper-type cytochrome/quinol oxidase subunit 3